MNVADLSGLPDELKNVIEDTNGEIDQLSTQLENGSISIEQWQVQMESVLATAFQDAAEAGADGADTEPLQDGLDNYVAIQLVFLANFAADIAVNGWLPEYQSRARMYGSAAKQGYWFADAYKRAGQRVLPLPAMPGEGTQCLTNCKCSWDVTTLDAAAGDYDAFWRRHITDSCQTCVQREAQWSPVRIRGGVLL